MAPHGVFRSAGEDRWVSVAVRDDEEWQRFCRTIDRPELGNDARFATLAGRKHHEDALEAIVTEWTRSRLPEEATTLLQAAGIPAAPVMNNKDLSTDPHLNSRPIFVYNEHPEVGVKQHVGIPWRLSKTPLSVRPAPLLGQDTDYVLREVLGYSEQEVAAFREKQALT
jgi:crotonobetainyl-CoA:carnitine CoA-transferase CaiB-like acyl-CoA transferase